MGTLRCAQPPGHAGAGNVIGSQASGCKSKSLRPVPTCGTPSGATGTFGPVRRQRSPWSWKTQVPPQPRQRAAVLGTRGPVNALDARLKAPSVGSAHWTRDTARPATPARGEAPTSAGQHGARGPAGTLSCPAWGGAVGCHGQDRGAGRGGAPLTVGRVPAHGVQVEVAVMEEELVL